MDKPITILKYYKHLNPDFAGNPLIEVMPPLSRNTISSMMSLGVSATADERTHPEEERLRYTFRLTRYFIPLKTQIDCAEDLWATILDAYRPRNPLKRETAEAFHEFCEAIYAGTVFENNDAFIFSPIAAGIIGTPGTGKGRTIQALLQNLPRSVLHHQVHGPVYQLFYVWAEAPSSPGNKSLLHSIYHKLIEAAESTGLPVARIAVGSSNGIYENSIAILAKKLNLGVLIVDEAQHLIGKSHYDKATMEFLTGFVNRISIPVILIGTWPALAIFGSEVRLARRNICRASKRFMKMKNDTVWKQFLQGLFRLQWTSNFVEFDDDFVDVFYTWCQGIADLAVKLMMLSQLHAIRSKVEAISVGLVIKVAEEHFPTIAPAIKQMREGWNEDDPILWDLEPTDFEAYYRALVAETIGRSQLDAKRHAAQDKAFVKMQQVIEGLTGSGFAAEIDATALAEKGIEQSPHKSAPEIVAETIAKAAKRGPRPTKSPKKQERVHAEFEALDGTDLRRIAYFAYQDGRSVVDVFAENGQIFSAIEEAIT